MKKRIIAVALLISLPLWAKKTIKEKEQVFIVEDEVISFSITDSCKVTLNKWNRELPNKLSTALQIVSAIRFVEAHCMAKK